MHYINAKKLQMEENYNFKRELIQQKSALMKRRQRTGLKIHQPKVQGYNWRDWILQLSLHLNWGSWSSNGGLQAFFWQLKLEPGIPACKSSIWYVRIWVGRFLWPDLHVFKWYVLFEWLARYMQHNALPFMCWSTLRLSLSLKFVELIIPKYRIYVGIWTLSNLIFIFMS